MAIAQSLIYRALLVEGAGFGSGTRLTYRRVPEIRYAADHGRGMARPVVCHSRRKKNVRS
jgi:hypothetical protein